MIIHSPKELAAFVNNHRKNNEKITQAKASKLVGIKQVTLSAFENKPGSTKLETLFKILAAVNLELSIAPKGSSISGWEEEW